jgi:hypothetical protein
MSQRNDTHAIACANLLVFIYLLKTQVVTYFALVDLFVKYSCRFPITQTITDSVFTEPRMRLHGYGARSVAIKLFCFMHNLIYSHHERPLSGPK